MRIYKVIIGSIMLASLVLAAAGAPSAGSVSLNTLSDAVNNVYVSSVTMDPEVFYPGETGTITVTVKNSGNITVTLSSPVIYDPAIVVYNPDSFMTKSRIGSGDTIDYVYKVSVDAPDGKTTFFPIFSVNPDIGNAIHAQFALKTDSGDLQASVTGQPDTFTLNNAGAVNLTLINPRDAAVRNIHITASGPGLSVNPSDTYVSRIGALNSTELTFSVTPSRNSLLTFNVSFASSDNVRYTNATIPVIPGIDKTGAVPVVNNPYLSSRGSYYDLTADISNAGVSDAKGVIVSVRSPARATGTYPEYAVGTLIADDSSSFEVTFTCPDLSQVPLEISWKDSSGNNYNLTKILDLSDTASAGSGTRISGASSGNGISANPGGYYRSSGSVSRTRNIFSRGGNVGQGISAFYPIIIGGIVLGIAAVLWVKRKPILARIRKR